MSKKQLYQDLNVFPHKLKCIKTTDNEFFIKDESYKFQGLNKYKDEPEGLYKVKGKLRLIRAAKEYIMNLVQEGYLKVE